MPFNKVYLNSDVFTETQKRVEFIFSEFDNIIIAFSGGKDSSICLNLFYDYAVKHNMTNKLAVWFKDEEVIHSETLAFVKRVFEGYTEINNKYWLCLPLRERYPNSMTITEWKAWDVSEKQLWVREYPETPYLITQENCPFPFQIGDDIHSIGDNFCKRYKEKFGGSTCQIVGLRAGESLNRTRTVMNGDRKGLYKGVPWTTERQGFVSAYPLYDWVDEDIWVANSKNKWDYNRVYDLYYQLGYSLKQMRVSTPFHESGQKMLKFWAKTDPYMWSKITDRVPGINFAALYTGTEGLNTNLKLPSNCKSWVEYKNLLLGSLPAIAREKYESNLKEEIKTTNEKVAKSICESILRGDYSLKYFKGEKEQKKKEEKLKDLKSKYKGIIGGV